MAGSLPALLAASWFYYPYVFDGPTFCGFKILLGAPCMGCGLTRAFTCMAHGEFARAVAFHPLAPVTFLWIVVWWVTDMRDRLRGTPEAPFPAWFTSINGIFIGLFLAFWVARLTVFFASPAGLESVLTKNLPARIVRWDWSNTHENHE